MTTYTDVQFIGYAIPSIPKQVADIGGPDSPGFVEGRYIGIDPDRVDLDARIALIMHAIRQTVLSGAVDAAESTLKIFVMPEFLLRGRRGAYDTAEFAYFCEEFAKRVGAPAYEGWLFVAGTIVNSTDDYHRGADKGRDLAARVREDLAIALANAWQHSLVTQDAALSTAIFQSLRAYTAYCHANPIYEVTDRAYVVAGGAPDPTYPTGLSVEKKFLSNEDFVLNLYKDAHSEEDEAYPPIDEKAGENKQSAFDDLGIFTLKGIKFGVEVCLDHYKARLRSNRSPDTELVQIHLIASCGMQIMQPSVIAGNGGFVFNCDGQYGGLDEQSQPNSQDSIWTGTDKTRAHTQLTQVVTPCSGNDLAGAHAVLRRPAATVTTVPVDHSSVTRIYAYGAGEVHIYTSLPVPASCG
jgi:hypothetical protein